jgi:antitoxin ParD1/3/4
MPTRNISLTTTRDAFIDRMVRSGAYQNASEAVRDALRLLQQRKLEDAAKLKALRNAVRTGIADLEAGRFETFDTGDALQDYLTLSERILSGHET